MEQEIGLGQLTVGLLILLQETLSCPTLYLDTLTVDACESTTEAEAEEVAEGKKAPKARKAEKDAASDEDEG